MTIRGADAELAQTETADDIIYPEPNTTGEGDLPLNGGTAMLAAQMALGLKELRIERGLTIEDIASKSGLDMATLTQLESCRNYNPRLDTLSRYALALGYEIEAQYVPLDPDYQD